MKLSNVQMNFLKYVKADVCQKENLDVKIWFINAFKYVASEILRKGYSLQRGISKTFKQYEGFAAYYEPNLKMIALKKGDKRSDCNGSGRNFTEIIFNLFHELGHAVQYQHATEVTSFLLCIENVVKLSGKFDYQTNHDMYYTEINADDYACEKLMKFPDEYISPISKEECYSYAAYRKTYVESRKLMYNFDDFYNAFCSESIEKGKLCDTDWYNVFFDELGDMRSVNDVFNQERLIYLEPYIVYSILGSQAFLKNVDFSKLDMKQQKMIGDALDIKCSSTNAQYLADPNNKKLLLRKELFENCRWLLNNNIEKRVKTELNSPVHK